MKFEWEWIDDHYRRAKVLGGWLVEGSTAVTHNMIADGRGMESGWDYRIALCFVPDEGHYWKVDK